MPSGVSRQMAKRPTSAFTLDIPHASRPPLGQGQRLRKKIAIAREVHQKVDVGAFLPTHERAECAVRRNSVPADAAECGTSVMRRSTGYSGELIDAKRTPITCINSAPKKLPSKNSGALDYVESNIP